MGSLVEQAVPLGVRALELQQGETLQPRHNHTSLGSLRGCRRASSGRDTQGDRGDGESGSPDLSRCDPHHMRSLRRGGCLSSPSASQPLGP